MKVGVGLGEGEARRKGVHLKVMVLPYSLSLKWRQLGDEMSRDNEPLTAALVDASSS